MPGISGNQQNKLQRTLFVLIHCTKDWGKKISGMHQNIQEYFLAVYNALPSWSFKSGMLQILFGLKDSAPNELYHVVPPRAAPSCNHPWLLIVIKRAILHNASIILVWKWGNLLCFPFFGRDGFPVEVKHRMFSYRTHRHTITEVKEGLSMKFSRQKFYTLFSSP